MSNADRTSKCARQLEVPIPAFAIHSFAVTMLSIKTNQDYIYTQAWVDFLVAKLNDTTMESVGRVGGGSEGRRTATRFDPAGHWSSKAEWN
jgi:hypothetical protein